MERAEARKMQPHQVAAFFLEAFRELGGRCQEVEPRRYELRWVPAEVCARGRALGAAENRSREVVVQRYERVCFEKELVRVPGKPPAAFLHPGHPLLKAVLALMLEKHAAAFRQGTVLIDPDDWSAEPRLLFLLDHTVQEGGSGRTLSRLVQFVKIDREGRAVDAAWAPHLDLRAVEPEERALIADMLREDWLSAGLERRAQAFAMERIVPEHYRRVRESHERAVDRQRDAVRERLTREITWWDGRTVELRAGVAAGKVLAASLENARRTVEELSVRLDTRLAELAARRDTISLPPALVSGALVIPRGLLEARRGNETFRADAQARAAVERIAMQAVMETERRMGHEPEDVSARKEGWDITSRPPARGEVLPDARFIEVKGRAAGQASVTVTRNEIVCGLNLGPRYFLAVVFVDGEKVDGPHYIRRPFLKEPDPRSVSVNYDLADLMEKAEKEPR
jgi:hypothetical protein